MKNIKFFITQNPRPVCVGTGLVALDVVINESHNLLPRLWAGGSCGNVLSILSYFGWRTYPIARLGIGNASRQLLRDLRKWRVNISLVSQANSGSTPIIVEKIGTNKSGMPWHRFEWTCPNCGSQLPRYKPVLVKNVEKISNKMSQAQVFYFDRVAHSSIELAKINRNGGALIVFEPCGIKDKKLFLECLKVADIVKYSYSSIDNSQAFFDKVRVPLEIVTLGAEGLKYRLDKANKANRKWKTMQSYSVNHLKDSAGSGDWSTAGIIHKLGSGGRKSFEEAEMKDIKSALSFGQALATLNCYYEGARGSMYAVSKLKFQKLLSNIWKGTSPLECEEKEIIKNVKIFRSICPYCRC